MPSIVDYNFLEHCLREDLNKNANRAMAVLRPVKLTVTNYPEGKTEMFEVENNPENPEAGFRKVSFSRNLWIEADDFEEVPPKKYNRLYPGNEVRLKSAYIVRCTGCVKDETEMSPRSYASTTPFPPEATQQTGARCGAPYTGLMPILRLRQR